MDENKPNLLSRKDSIFGVIEFLTLSKLVQIQYLNKDFFNKFIPNMTKRIYWRKPSGKEEYTQPVLIKNDEFRKVYYSRFKNLISLGLYEIEIDENFLKTFKIVVENNYQNLEVLELFYISFKNENLADEFMKLVLCLKNISKLEINNSLSLPFQIYFSDNLLKETSFFINLKLLSFHYIEFMQFDKLLYSCEKLESLHLTSCKLSNVENLNKLIEYLNHCKLTNLSFQYEDFEPSNLKPFLSVLRQSKHLRSLVFDNCTLNGIENLKFDPNFLSNNLHLSKISVINSKNIMEFLIHLINPLSLEIIQMSSCYINDTLLELISDNLVGCKLLHSVDLGQNKFTHSGLKYFLTKIEYDILSTLRYINLAGNKGIENEGLKTLFNTLIKISTISLKKINLTNCVIDLNISEECISELIYTMLLKNTSFELVLLRNITIKTSEIQNFINIFGGKMNSLNISNVKGNINLYAFKLDYKKIDNPTIQILENLRVKHGIILN